MSAQDAPIIVHRPNGIGLQPLLASGSFQVYLASLNDGLADQSAGCGTKRNPNGAGSGRTCTSSSRWTCSPGYRFAELR